LGIYIYILKHSTDFMDITENRTL